VIETQSNSSGPVGFREGLAVGFKVGLLVGWTVAKIIVPKVRAINGPEFVPV